MRDEGFTLIEVLAALVIFSLAIVTLVSMSAQSTRTASAVHERMLARIVADNVIIEARRKAVRLGENEGVETAKGRSFEWQQNIERTELENYFRITVQVRLTNEDQVLIERIAYRGPGDS